jgi:hypothetical protein
MVSENEYEIIDTKENIKDFIIRRVVPLYDAAIFNLETFYECYYWKN